MPQLDWNLMREVLLAIDVGADPFALAPHPRESIAHTVWLLGNEPGNAGWIVDVPKRPPYGTTDNGRAIAGLIRDPKVWRLMRSQATKKLGSRERIGHLFSHYLATTCHAPLLARREALCLHIKDIAESSGVGARTIYRCEAENRLPLTKNDRAAYLAALLWNELEAVAAIDAAVARARANALMAPMEGDSKATAKVKRAHASRRNDGARA